MEYNIISTILNLTHLTFPAIRVPSKEFNLINQLNEFFDFDHNIFLLDSTLDPSRYVSILSPTFDSEHGKYTPQSVYTFDNSPGSNFTDIRMINLDEITSKNTFLIVAVENLDFDINSTIMSEIRRIRSLQIITNIKVGVFVRNEVTSMDIIEQLSEWSWNIGIVNIFFAFFTIDEVNAVFRYEWSFESIDLINVTESDSLQNYFRDKIPNFHQHPIRFLQLSRYVTPYFVKNLWLTVVRIFNASMSITYITEANYYHRGLQQDVFLRERVLSENIQIYPHRMANMVLMVPHAQPYSGFVEYLQNTTWKLLFGYTLIVAMASSSFLTVTGYWRTKKILFFHRLSDVVNLLINNNEAIRYGQLHHTDAYVIVPLTFTGLIVMNGILSAFKSYLTLPIYGRQLNSIEDLYKSTVPILASELYWANRTIQILENLTHYGGWNDKVHEVNVLEADDIISMHNTSIAFFLGNYYADVIKQLQERVKLKAYHLMPDIILEKVLYSFQLNQHFPLQHTNDIIHNLQSAGLIDKWQNDAARYDITEIQRRYFKRKISNELSSDEFTIPTVLWCGWIASVIVFLCEIIWSKVKLNVKLQIRKLKIR